MAADPDAAENAAIQRKERLRALRAAAELSSATDNDPKNLLSNDLQGPPLAEDSVLQEQKEQEVKFRNYLPRDKQFQPNKLAPPAQPKFDDPVASSPLAVNGTEDPFINIAPKKANWDLRRDVAKKLEKLERRTQRAIIELMQEEERRRQGTVEDGEQAEQE